MHKEKAISSFRFSDIDLSSVRVRNELLMRSDDSLGRRKGRYLIKFSVSATLFLEQLQERAQILIDDSENPIDANELAVNNLRKLLYLSQVKARIRVGHVSVYVRKRDPLRPVVTALDIQRALKTLCPIWPFC